MRLSISNIAWPAEADSVVAALLRRHGLDAIDVAPGILFPDLAAATPADIAARRGWWADREIEIVGMQALLYGTEGLNLFGPPPVQAAMLAHLGRVCRLAAGLGARRLVFGSPRNRNRSGLSDADATAVAAAFFRRLGDIAALHGCTICLEPNPPAYGANFMTDLASAAAAVRATDHPAIRLQLDVGALAMTGEDPAEALAATAPLVAHIHASEPHLAVLGDDGTGHATAAAAIRRYCPDRVVAIEMRAAPEPLPALDRALGFAVATYGDPA